MHSVREKKNICKIQNYQNNVGMLPVRKTEYTELSSYMYLEPFEALKFNTVTSKQ